MDDFDNPPMTDLVRRWARKVRAEGRSGPLGATPDLDALHGELDRVDAEHAADLPVRQLRWRPAAALAAAVLVAILVWSWLWGGSAGGLPALGGTPPRILDVALAPQREIVRGRPAAPLESGEPLYLHYFAEHPGWALVALLRPPASVSQLTPGPVALSVDDEPLGPFRLEGGPGLAGLLVVTSAEAPSPAQVRQVIEAAASALRASPVGSESELRATVLAAFGDARGLRAVCVPFVLR